MSFQSQPGLRGRRCFGAEGRARQAGFWANGDLGTPWQQRPGCILPPPSPQGWGHRVPKDAQTLRTEDYGVLKEKIPPGQAGGVSRAALGTPCHPFPPYGAVPMSLRPERSGDPIPTGHPSGDRVGTWQPGSRPLGAGPAQGRSQRVSRCPRHRDKVPPEPPTLPAPATCRPQLHTPQLRPLLPQLLHRGLTPQNPPASSNKTTHLSPCPPRNGHSTSLSPLPRLPNCCPTPHHGSHHVQWGQGLGRGATGMVSPGQRWEGC